MSSSPISSAIELNIQMLGLNGTGAKIVRGCVAGYTMPAKIWDQLSFLAYRIWNAVKAIFGYSDWQQACQVIENQERYFLDLIPQQYRKKHSQQRLRRQAEEMLNCLVQLNQGGGGENQPFKQLFQQIGLVGMEPTQGPC